jgi:hypothetical protein
VHGSAVEAVVVVPLERGPFGAARFDQVVDVGLAPARRDQQVVAGLARRQVGGDLAVERGRLVAGEAAGLPVELGAVVAAVEMDGEVAGTGRQPVVEGDLGAAPGGAADGRPREAAAVGPEARLGARQDLLVGRADRDQDLVGGVDRREAQRLAEGDGGAGGRGPAREQAPAAAPQRRQDCERAAAEGAEEGSAPQAVPLLPGRRGATGRQVRRP